MYGVELEIVMNELRKNQNFNFDLQIPPTLPNGTYLVTLPYEWIYIYKGPKLLKCRIINLLEEYFLLLNTFHTFFVTCTNFKKKA